MRRIVILLLTFALAGVVAPAATATSNRVDYWLDRDPGVWTGGMVVIRRGGKYWAYAKFFEGRVCLSGRRSGPSVRMKGTFEQYERERAVVASRGVRFATWARMAGVVRAIAAASISRLALMRARACHSTE